MAEWSSSTITCVPEGEQRVALASEISKVSKAQCEHVKPLRRLGQLPPAPSPRKPNSCSSPRKKFEGISTHQHPKKKAVWQR
jgi:hypothetical protein